jgi:hypothetical protein
VGQKGFAEHVQQYELGSEMLGKPRGPVHDLASDRGIIHRGENASRSFLDAVTYDQGGHGEAPDEALEGAASVSVHRLASQYHEVRFEISGHVSQA